MKNRSNFALSAVLALTASSLMATTLCVAPGGKGGCYSKIQDAVNAAAPNDTITVSKGTYKENVLIGKPLSLIGDGSANTLIDATGLANGINVDGHGHAGLNHVAVDGFTVANANLEGILVTDSTFVTISNSHVTGNDVSLQPFAQGGPFCPGLPSYFVPFQLFDCGEGIHLSGVSHSTLANNVVDKNAGGILLSDDTGANHDNLIMNNTVTDNPYDCSITLASHILSFAPANPLAGVYHNTIAGNTALRNGLATGEGAGVGLFTAAPGGANWGNVVIGNTLSGNGLPGVALHSHAPNQINRDHIIVGNTISGNGPDSDPGTVLPAGITIFGDDAAGAAPVTGVVISQNVIKDEGIDIAVKTAGSVDAHFNSLFGDIGISNLGAGLVNATENWWKCSGGPEANGCSTVVGGSVQTSPWLTKPF